MFSKNIIEDNSSIESSININLMIYPNNPKLYNLWKNNVAKNLLKILNPSYKHIITKNLTNLHPIKSIPS